VLGSGISQAFAQGAGRRQIAEGNKHYTEGKFDEASDKYRDAEASNPESPIVHFNIGDALYKKRKYEEALQAYQKALQKSDDVQLQSQSHYNLGNTYFRLNKWQESLLSYQEALKLNPADQDAKYNLEYVRAKIKENAQKQPQDQQQQPVTPSDYAKRLKAQADALVAQRRYRAAHELMIQGLQTDKTVAAYQNFIDRLKKVADIQG
jgi:tetratricopeptide (TPR) repeat protein